MKEITDEIHERNDKCIFSVLDKWNRNRKTVY
jgi:hypothetical protein